jgi:phosphoenolpyruvate carboxylase
VQSIERDAEAFPGFSTATSKLNVLEPYRRKLDFMRLKLENALASVDQSAIEVGLGQTLVGATNTMYTAEISTTFARSNEFLDELMILYRSLESNGGKVLAEGKLADLINQVRVFGFHLAPLDLRQDADVHIAALADIFKTIGLEDLTTMTKEEQCEVFLRELLNPRPLGISAILSQLQPQSQEVFRTLQVGADSIQNISPRSISTYIISMSTHERDVLALMLLMNEVGLIEISDGRVTRAYMDIAPLFETKEDLEHAAEVMHRLDNMDLYQSYLDLRGNVQEIMVGYSDSTKDVGILESNYRLILAQQELERVTREHNSVVRIFHGRGGSVSRGGGPTNQAILALPPNTTRHVKITEQGEVIGQSYANPQIALTHLEGIISAMIIRGVQDRRTEIEDNPTFMDAASQKILSGLASISRETYEAMVKRNKDFIPFYLQFTPLDLIERATIGSRPSRRTKDNVSSISALRAIPWIFSFTQTRLIFPGYFGLGTALKAFDEAGDFGKLQELYRSLPYFETMISNIQMVMLKADMNIAELYLDLLEDGNREIFTRIREEFELTREYIIRLSQTDDLLGIAPDIRNSIRRRNPYLDPLSILQVALLKEWRKNGRPEDMGPMSLQRLLLQTVNGIAAGLKNTG